MVEKMKKVDQNDIDTTELFYNGKEKETQDFKCASCGNILKFNPETQKLCCEYCGSEKNIDEWTKSSEKDLVSAFNNFSKTDDETVVYRCNNCGAKEVILKTDIAKSCSFCGTTNIVKIEELSGIKPDAVLPFTIGRETAYKIAKTWLNKKAYAPKKAKKTFDVDSMHGIYSPCWTFDSNTFSSYNGRIGKYVTRTYGSGENRRTVTEIRWRTISGTYANFFDDVLIEAGPNMDEKKMNKIRPFNTNNSLEYNSKFLSGFSANHYSKDIVKAWEEAKNKMAKVLRDLILRQYTYDVVDYLNVNTVHSNTTYKYVLLPIWIGTFQYKKKTYSFYINGTTGKIWGKIPISAAKVCATVFGALVGIGAIIVACVLL